ncbi:MAG: leucine-rich repeat domain-containing protein [Anaerolineae bacterium]|nr:leucine-rich repeat domain-containing protein [Anaerolineae bacterium]
MMGNSSRERQALVAIYEATGGENWPYQSNWLSEQPLCCWEGVTWTNGHVVALELTNNNLLGALPPEIGHLNELRMLWLDHNQLSKIPSTIGQLVKLQDLALSDNQLVVLPAEIGRLTQLQMLYLNDNRLQEIPREIGRLTNLEALDLSGNQFAEFPAEIRYLSNLKNLWAEQISIKDAGRAELLTSLC